MKSETKLFAGIIAATVIIVAIGIALLSKPAKPVIVDPLFLSRADSNKIATSSAKVTLVEFSDFQCPACRVYYQMVKELTGTYKDSMTFVYRNYPLTDLHPNALLAAAAAEAAGLQGKYWEMYDALFTKQVEWSGSNNVRDIFTSYAESLELNIGQFQKDIDSDAVKNRVAADIADGNTLGINSTPTFYLNNRKIENPATLVDFESVIKAAIAAAKE